MSKRINNVGLCVAFKGTSYGALLQTFATQYIIEKMGFNTEIIDYTLGKTNRYHYSVEALVYLSLCKIKGYFFPKQDSSETVDDLHRANIIGRKAVAEKFRNEMLKNIVSVKGYADLQELASKYDAVIVGSDQMWSPDVSFSNFLSLRFAPIGVRRISYATSTGVSKYPWYVKRQAKQFLSEIDYLSVREDAGYNIIKEITGRKAVIVADPTYLLTKQEWLEIIPNGQVTQKGYVFSFFLGDNPEMKKLVRQYADTHNLRVVSILSNEVNVDDSWYSDEILISKAPNDFINLIRNAECVFTDSFHGFTFSIINEKEVYVSYRVRKGIKSRNQRIDNIVKKYNVEDRLIRNPDGYIFSDDRIDYKVVTQKVNEFREFSLAFLMDALSKHRDE